ncbi:MAG: hypothetical protein ACR2NZ_22620, partial [Rubripirellula sp.]
TNFPGLDQPGETCWDTRKIMIGALTARKKNLELLIDSSEMDQWADYSLYDCAACHHELKSQSRRQNRGDASTPGRPRQPEWTDLQLLQVGKLLADDETELAKLEQRLTHAFAARPFGDESQVVRNASELRDRLQSAISKGETATINCDTARAILIGLLDTPTEQIITYDSARQVVWAIRAISSELNAMGQGLPPEVEQMIQELDQPATGDGKIGIATQLPAGRSEFIYERGLREDLERRAAFDPDRLAERLRTIATALRGSSSGS